MLQGRVMRAISQKLPNEMVTPEKVALRDAIRADLSEMILGDETFRTIVGFERYLVSDRGRVFSAVRACRFMKPWLTTTGYWHLYLMAAGASKPNRASIHRLVARAFIPNPSDLPTVNHKNGIKTDNAVGNLEWCSYGDNNDHARDTGLTLSFGEFHYASKLTDADVRRIRELGKTNLLHRDIGAMFGVKRQAIDKIINGQAWRRTA